MASNSSSTNITTRQQLNPGAYPVGAPFSIENIGVVTNTTTVDTTLGQVVTNVSYIPYMRGIDIEFVGYRLRPYRQIYHYFDNNPVNAYIERPNIIETTSYNPELKDLRKGRRETIVINGMTAHVLHTELDETSTTGNTRIYVDHFIGSSSVSIGDTITSRDSAYTSTVKSYVHNSGKVGASSTNTNIVLAFDADTTTTNFYKGNVITLVTGASAGQSAEIIEYNETTRTATVSPAFKSIDSNTIYSIGDARNSWSSNTTQTMFVSPKGFTSGVLHVPDPSIGAFKVRTGDRIFRILDNARNDIEAYTTRADYLFVSNGLNLSKAQIIERQIFTDTTRTYDVLLPPTPTPTPTPSPTPSRTPDVTPSPTRTQTPEPSQSRSPTPSPSVTPTMTPTVTPTVTPSVTPSMTPTESRPPLPSPSPTPSPSVTRTMTPTVTPTRSGTPGITPTRSPTRTVTPSSTLPVTPSVTPTRTVTPSLTPTMTPTVTPTPSPVINNPCASFQNASDVTYFCAAATNIDAWSSITRYVYTDSAGKIIQGSPNVYWDPTNLIFSGRGSWSLSMQNGSQFSTLGGVRPTSALWHAGLSETYATNYPAGYRFPDNTYIGFYGVWGFRGPWNVSGLYANPVFCREKVASDCLKIPHDPIAQTFYVDATSHKDGVFLTSVDLFFANKGSLPVEVQIRPVVNGYPSSNTVIPGATIVKEPEEIVISNLPNTENSSTNTRFIFPSPVYLNSGYEYAVVVLTDDYDYDYYCAELGKTILGTDRIISKQPFMGSLFKSQNARTWNAIQDEDMMFVLNKAAFVTGNTGIARFEEDNDKLDAITYANTVFDAFEIQSDAIELNSTKLNYFYKATSNSTGVIDSLYTDITPDKKVNDLTERKVVTPSSYNTNSFDMKVEMSTTNTDVSPTIFQNRQNFVAIENLINNNKLEADKYIITNRGGGYTSNVEINLTADAGYGANAYIEIYDGKLSNVIIRSAGAGYVGNVTASLVHGEGYDGVVEISTETRTSGGPSLARYISQTITLLDGFDAGDLRLFLTAVKPSGSDIQVYYKTRNSQDPDPIERKNWVRMVQKTSELTYSVRGEQIEYEYRPSLTSNNIVYSTEFNSYKTFNQFAIKVTLASNGTVPSAVPYVYDLRAIALPEDVY